MQYLLLMLLGTAVTRLCTLHRDSPEERRDGEYQLIMFCIYFLVYVIAYGVVAWIHDSL
jgi:hypothetical protein